MGYFPHKDDLLTRKATLFKRDLKYLSTLVYVNKDYLAANTKDKAPIIKPNIFVESIYTKELLKNISEYRSYYNLLVDVYKQGLPEILSTGLAITFIDYFHDFVTEIKKQEVMFKYNQYDEV